MDITKCTGGSCPLKEKCFRYTAKGSDYWQSYFVGEPFFVVDDQIKCDHFWEVST